MEFSVSELQAIASSGPYKRIPVKRELLADFITPVEAMRALRGASHHCFMLESAEESAHWGRYTFLGFDPAMEITCANGELRVRTGVEGQEAAEQRMTVDHPGEFLRQVIADNRSPQLEGFPTFTGGLVGYFSYDYIKYAEPTLRRDDLGHGDFLDMDLMLCDKLVVLDHYRQKIILIVNISLDQYESEYHRAELELQHMADLIQNGTPAPNVPGQMTSPMRPLFSKEQYCSMVEKAKHHIREGDIFQIVLSNRLEADFEGSLFNAYRILRTVNPSPYMFYFSSSDLEVAGASPETLVKLEDGVLHTFPLAGTRPRGKTEAEDKQLEAELLADPKELAEHNMLVDLGRNDIGKISKFGSVAVEKYHSIERYSHVMHIGSTVRGELADDRTALDAIDAILPAGTLSGAPKIRACQLINDLENNKRGIYGGAIGYLDFTGNLDTCIAIRIAYKKNGKVFVRSGAGIVADSVPESEYQECINKAAAVVKALEAGGSL